MLVGPSSGDGGASFIGEIISLIKRNIRGEENRRTLPELSLGPRLAELITPGGENEKLRPFPFICISLP